MRRLQRGLLALVAVMITLPPAHAACPVPVAGVPYGYRRVAAAHGIPSALFYAIALAESGKHIERLHAARPWPWTLNIHGEGRYYPSREKALEAVHRALGNGRLSVDIGLMQVNWQYHAAALRTVDSAIDPYHNLDVAAEILAECYSSRGDWWAAVGCYHAPGDADRAARYRDRVQRIWSRITAIG
ncbi:MAG: lytic transglycosylase domain-containing protein [Nitrococcus sp.]|nr:lytic transglycosylase domain-containing protein [Nitrococcus sp.]